MERKIVGERGESECGRWKIGGSEREILRRFLKNILIVDMFNNLISAQNDPRRYSKSKLATESIILRKSKNDKGKTALVIMLISQELTQARLFCLYSPSIFSMNIPYPV